jgi:uncharacterized membrane protein HdeD (DUF308 family)
MTGTMAANMDMNAEGLRSAWGWLMALGILMIVLGVIAIGIPIAISVTMTIFLGILLLVAGVAQLAQGIASHQWGGFFIHLLGAVVYILFGLALLVNPEVGVRALTLLLAMYFIISGFIKIMMAIISHGARNWGWMLFSGIVSFILGALIWSQWPSNADWVIGLLVGIDLLFTGWGLVMLAIAARTMPPAAAS